MIRTACLFLLAVMLSSLPCAVGCCCCVDVTVAADSFDDVLRLARQPFPSSAVVCLLACFHLSAKPFRCPLRTHAPPLHVRFSAIFPPKVALAVFYFPKLFLPDPKPYRTACRHMLRQTGLEIFMEGDGGSAFFNFESRSQRDEVSAFVATVVPLLLLLLVT